MTEKQKIQEKIQALNTRSCILVVADIINIVKELMAEQTGLKLKQDNIEVTDIGLLDELKLAYIRQLQQIQDSEPKSQQLDLETAIDNAKKEQYASI